ncbi:hypothetical protein DSCA_19600 [Desulfosarcina alkanivorans]|jgi:hypothetical protein|uniref:Uncharacterized protein n=1 Tax=Desulfosarcina alkanivorans TaxID=571177 RepID=A0A5K7YIU6_9BACT|nr:hypothetical protein DSCA_19600 [Desulfosarcina alkanivorans]
MYYSGIDLHRKTSFVTAVDLYGRIVRKAYSLQDKPTILDYFPSLDDDTLVVIESNCKLVRDAVRMKNRVHNIKAKNNLSVPAR